MLLFSLPGFDYLTRPLVTRGYQLGSFELKRFPNDELQVLVKSAVRNQDATILGTLAPPGSNLVELTMLAQTLRSEGAKHITAILPYLAYSRQDQPKSGESLATKWLSQLLSASGIDRIVTIDIHSPAATELIELPVESKSPAELLATHIKELRLPGITVVAPDEGALARARALANAANISSGVHLEKVRADGPAHLKLVDGVGRSVILVDDILDTGGTLISAAKLLRQAGAEDIFISISHGLFTGNDWQRLWMLGVKKIYCLDTVPAVCQLKDKRLKIISCTPLLIQ